MGWSIKLSILTQFAYVSYVYYQRKSIILFHCISKNYGLIKLSCVPNIYTEDNYNENVKSDIFCQNLTHKNIF